LAGKKINVKIDPAVDRNTIIENIGDTPTLILGPSVARDETAILQQYALYILNSHRVDLHLDKVSEDNNHERSLINLWWGMADYLNCSHRNDPIVGKILGQLLQAPYLRNLENDRKFSEIDESSAPQDAGEIWGGALWEIRMICGQGCADKMFFDVWLKVQPGDDTQKIAQRFLEHAQSIEGGDYVEKIRAAFSRRDLKL
jgi:hypothetical protein